MRSILYLIISVFFGAGSGFFIQLLLAKTLPVDEYGLYTSIINLSNLIAPLIAFGITNFLLRTYSIEGHHASRWMKSTFKLLFLTTLLAFITLQSISFYKNGISEYFLLYCLFFMYILSISYNSFTTLKYQIEDNHKLLAIWQLAPKLILFSTLLLIIVALGASIKKVGLAYGITGLIVTIFSINSLIDLYKGNLKLKFIIQSDKYSINPTASLLNLIRNSYPYGLSGLFYLIYYQSDILILNYYLDYTQVGYYGFSLIFVTSVCLIPTVYYMTYKLRSIHYLSKNDKRALRFFYKNHIKYSSGIGLIFFLIFLVSIKPFITIIFEDKYLPALPILYSLSLYIPIKFLTLNADAIMHTEEFVSIKVKIMGVAAILNLTINIILIPTFNLFGAVFSTLVTELFLLIAFHISIRRKLYKLYNVE